MLLGVECRPLFRHTSTLLLSHYGFYLLSSGTFTLRGWVIPPHSWRDFHATTIILLLLLLRAFKGNSCDKRLWTHNACVSASWLPLTSDYMGKFTQRIVNIESPNINLHHGKYQVCFSTFLQTLTKKTDSGMLPPPPLLHITTSQASHHLSRSLLKRRPLRAHSGNNLSWIKGVSLAEGRKEGGQRNPSVCNHEIFFRQEFW